MVSNRLTINHFSFQYSCAPASQLLTHIIHGERRCYDTACLWWVGVLIYYQNPRISGQAFPWPTLFSVGWRCDGVVTRTVFVWLGLKTNLSRGSSEWLDSVGLDFLFFFFIVWRVSEVIGLNIQCGYVILLIEMGPSCRPTLNWDVSQIIWKNMTNYYLLYSGLGWQNPHWFGLDTGRKCYSLICRFSEIGRAQIKKCWPERDKPLSRRSTCASLKSVTVIAEMHRRSCQHTQTQSACI